MLLITIQRYKTFKKITSKFHSFFSTINKIATSKLFFYVKSAIHQNYSYLCLSQQQLTNTL